MLAVIGTPLSTANWLFDSPRTPSTKATLAHPNSQLSSISPHRCATAGDAQQLNPQIWFYGIMDIASCHTGAYISFSAHSFGSSPPVPLIAAPGDHQSAQFRVLPMRLHLNRTAQHAPQPIQLKVLIPMEYLQSNHLHWFFSVNVYF
ncbi:hypothetical protein PGT21_002583 [Puccinia graminis f. sp. tritici]|uniref:Uncharacterized protein n=1 Tax=Puccinia graminis f. sp. tritici TaxID=56615 RepID=A0A5B0P3J8_PUCGR|nr:hypothetical protein PGT21_002583 [Puccinia graminis f. sp. tritici]